MNHSLAVTALGLSAALLASGQAQACETSCSSKKAKPMAQMASYAPGNSWGAKPDIVETAVAAGSFKTLAAALDAAGLVGALQGEGPFTVFAPSDEAFAKLPEAQLDELLKPENKALLSAILTYHVVPGRLTASEVIAMPGAGSLNGQRLVFAADANGVMIDDAKVVKANIECGNGVIHVIDTVMIPETKDLIEVAVDAGSFTTLAAALNAAHLVSTLQGDGPFTVFAPTDEAFAALPAGTIDALLRPEARDTLVAILTYHVVPGRVYAADAAAARSATTAQGGEIRIAIRDGRLAVNQANVVASDIESTNGVIHVIDQVLMPPTS